MTVTRADETAAHNAPHAFMDNDRDYRRAFRGAARHSRGVRILRIALPVAIGIGFIGIVLVTYFNPLRFLNKLPVDIGKLVVSGSKITMELPRLAGYTRDSRAYEMTARAAAQDLSNPDQVELQDIHAKVEMQDKSLMRLSAASGIYDTKSEILKLKQNILLTSSTGYEGRLSEAVVDIRKGNVVSENPVEVKLLNGTLNANRLEVVEAGDLVRFDGGVAMTLMMDGSALGSKAAASDKAAKATPDKAAAQ